MSGKSGAKPKNNYIFSAYDQLEWDTSLDGYNFTAEESLSVKSEMEYPFNELGTEYMSFTDPKQNNCVGLECISNFVDIAAFNQAMNYYGLKAPKYIVFIKPNALYKALDASAWTPALSKDRIFVNIEYYNSKDDVGVVEAIAHEAWHLTKQPRLIRALPGFRGEKDAGRIGQNVSALYKNMKNVIMAMRLSRRWK